MAYVANDQNQNPNQNPQNPLGQQAPVTTSAAPGTSGGGSPSGASAQPSNQSTGQPFTNLSSYLTANAPQIGQMAQNVAGDLTNQYGQIQSKIDSGVQDFSNQVKSGYAPQDQNVVTQATSNPAEFAKDPNNVTAFQKQLNDQYTGPGNFESTPGYQDISQNIAQKSPNADIGKNFGALQSYLQNQGGNATRGTNLLDTVLLKGNPDAIQTIQNAATPFAGLNDYLSGQVSAADQAVPLAQQEAQQASQNAQSKIGSTVSDFSNALNSNYQNAFDKSKSYNDLLNSVTGKISNNDFSSLTPEEMSLIGFNKDIIPMLSQYPSIFPAQASQHPINFSSYYEQGPQWSTPQPSDTVNPDQIAEYNALQMLTGNAPSTNFTMPQSSTNNAPSPIRTPIYSNSNALNEIYRAYNPYYSQIPQGAASAQQQQYMTTLAQMLNIPNPTPVPPGGLPPGWQPGGPGVRPYDPSMG